MPPRARPDKGCSCTVFGCCKGPGGSTLVSASKFSNHRREQELADARAEQERRILAARFNTYRGDVEGGERSRKLPSPLRDSEVPAPGMGMHAAETGADLMDDEEAGGGFEQFFDAEVGDPAFDASPPPLSETFNPAHASPPELDDDEFCERESVGGASSDGSEDGGDVEGIDSSATSKTTGGMAALYAESAFAPSSAPPEAAATTGNSTTTSTGPTKDDQITYLFHLLISWLVNFHQLPLEAAGVLLSFWNVFVAPRLGLQASPAQARTIRRRLGLAPDIIRYAVCPECSQLRLYGADDPLRPGEICARPGCTASIVSDSAAQKPQPVTSYGYVPLRSWLERLLGEAGMEAKLGEWAQRPRQDGVYRDVYDGSAWSEELDRHGDPYKETPLSLSISFGLDGFAPFHGRHTSTHSSGALFAALLDLPRDLREQLKYAHLAACTPGPGEPDAFQLPSYLAPFVDELRRFEEGVVLKTHSHPNGVLVRIQAHLFIGDSPARFKLGGLPSMQSHGMFCPYCIVTKSERAASVSSPFPLHSPDEHRGNSLHAQTLRTKVARDDHARQKGARYTELYRLSYWRSVLRMPVDAMHAVYLGVVKRFWLRSLLEGSLLKEKRLGRFQRVFREALVPTENHPRPDPRLGDPSGGNPTAAQWSTFARILLPFAFLSAFSAPLSAVEPSARSLSFHWKSRTTSSTGKVSAASTKKRSAPGGGAARAGDGRSEPAEGGAAAGPLQDGEEDVPVGEAREIRRSVDVDRLLENMLHLSTIAELSWRNTLTEQDVSALATSVQAFGQGQIELFGASWLTYNVHILQHLPDSIRRYGPPSAFWAFLFERGNGVLSSQKTNRRKNGQIELTYLLRATERANFSSVLRRLPTLPHYDPLFDPIYRHLTVPQQYRASELVQLDGADEEEGLAEGGIKLGRLKKGTLTPEVYKTLIDYLQTTYPEKNFVVDAAYVPGTSAFPITRAVKHPSHFRYRGARFSAASDRSNAAQGDSFGLLFDVESVSTSSRIPVQIMSAFLVESTNYASSDTFSHLFLRARVLRTSSDPHILHSEPWLSLLRCRVLLAGEDDGEIIVGIESLASQAALVPFSVEEDRLLWGFKELSYE